MIEMGKDLLIQAWTEWQINNDKMLASCGAGFGGEWNTTVKFYPLSARYVSI